MPKVHDDVARCDEALACDGEQGVSTKHVAKDLCCLAEHSVGRSAQCRATVCCPWNFSTTVVAELPAIR